ncbi:MAG TPA: hypothetical protein PLD25_17040 [Chloroflexota bacterium]|nr:hypothetical protein [Chloroflexota bacterium]
MSFDWRTEETVHWDEPPQVEPEPEPPPKRRRWRWGLLFLLLLLVGSSVAAFWLLQERVETATTDVTGDVIASHQLIATAAANDDAELVATFLSGRSREWSAAIERTVMAGDYQSRAAFGLTWLPPDPATAVISATLNPEFNEAEVVAEQVYAYAIGNGLTETVRLQQTAVYRLGPDRWLLSPPDANFWGETKTKQGFYLTLQYPARDETLAQRLALDMDTALAAMCANPVFTCPEGLHIQVELSTDPVSLTPDFASAVFVDGGRLFRLPTPTLAGIPQDETGYQVMARGYAAQVMLPIMRQLAGFVPGENGVFAQAWLDWQLARLGLRPYPLTPADRARLAAENITLAGEVSPEQMMPVAYALVAFLLQDVRVPPQVLLRPLTTGQADSYESWFDSVIDGRVAPEELQTRWQQFLER